MDDSPTFYEALRTDIRRKLKKVHYIDNTRE